DEIVYCKIYDWRADISKLFKGLKKRGKGMKFDFVIGNPPYQEEADIVVTTNGQSQEKIYFIISKLQLMIYQAKEQY
ncbi:MAG: Eco57I restriction-modification methylase domain-containing protein, partial [Butyrivibrio sp.]|nr:Eco57I restriction-modification methylase domain-containing protein [Butyrivibrio sp.]